MGRGVSAAAALLGVSFAALQIGRADPAQSAPPVPAGAQVAFDPAAVTVVATHLWPSRDWAGSQTVHVRTHATGTDLEDIKRELESASARLSSADGHQIAVELNDPRGDDGDLTVQVKAGGIQQAGEYSGALALDPLTPDSPALNVTVKARHHWIWPSLLVVLSALISALGTSFLQARRDKGVDRRWRKAWFELWNSTQGAVYLVALLLAGLAFLLPVYSGTNFGSWGQYLAVFLAGILGRVVAETFVPPTTPDKDPAALLRDR